MKIEKVLMLIFFLVGVSSKAQIVHPAQWSHKVSKNTIRKGETLELIFKVVLNENWHLFGNLQNYDLGPLPTKFEFKPNSSYTLLGEVRGIGFLNEYDHVFDVEVSYAQNTAEFRQKVRVLSDQVDIKGTYEYQLCNMVDGKCILGRKDFEYQILTVN